MWHPSSVFEITCHVFVTTVPVTNNCVSHICDICPIRVKLTACLNVRLDLYSYVLFPAIGNILVNKLINIEVSIAWLWVWFYMCSSCNLLFKILRTGLLRCHAREALNLLIAAALPFSAAYLPIVFAFHAIVRRMVIIGNCFFHRPVHLLCSWCWQIALLHQKLEGCYW